MIAEIGVRAVALAGQAAMAAAGPQVGRKRFMIRARLIQGGALLLLVALLAFGAWRWSDWRSAAWAQSAYAAHVVCSCRYVEGRDAASCAGDVGEDAWLASVRDDPARKLVRAHLLMLGGATARFRPGYGCLIDPR